MLNSAGIFTINSGQIMTKSININISSKSIFLFFSLTVLIWLITQITDVILLVFGSYVIACSLMPIINFLSKKMSRNWAIVIVYTSVILLIITLFFPLVGILMKEGGEFIRQFPDYWDALAKSLLKWNINVREIDLLPSTQNIASIIASFGENILNHTIHITHNIIVAFVMFFSLAILVLFMLLEKDELNENFLKFFHQKDRERVSLILSQISKGVGIYVGSKIILMIVVCMMSTVGLSFLGIKFALFLGLLAGILEILPMIGPIIASVPAIIVALTQDPKLALGVVILYFIIFKVANNILSPIILGKFLNISPIIIIAALFIGSNILGVSGVILSPAIVVVIIVLCNELYLNKINNVYTETKEIPDSVNIEPAIATD